MSKHLLLLKSVAGILFLFVIMGLVTFLPFGGLAYTRAWIYIGVFFGSSFIITIYLFLFDRSLLQKRLSVGPLAEPSVTQKIIQTAAGVLFLGIFAISSIDAKFQWSGAPVALAYISDMICLAAFVFLFYVFKQNTFLSATIEVQEHQHVVSTGFYAIVRHPMYSGALVLLLFTPLALGSFIGLLPAVCLIVVIAFRAIDEERNLAVNLSGYKEYCQKVKYRLIPYVF